MQKNSNTKNKFKFSVVVPIYNVEEYLEETILSVINQTIGFEENIQMILVNDGSPDNSEEICLQYQQEYPDNIIYVKQENAGVSAARNNGLQYAVGEYVNFLDSDDTWNKDAFEKINSFTLENPDIEVLCCRMRFFEASTKFHPFNYKFTTTRIVDITDEEEYTSVHMHITSSFVKTDIAKTIQFKKNMILGEDALYLNTLILKAGRYAAMANIQHNYRKRIAKSSAIQTKSVNIRFYDETIQKFYKSLISLSLEFYGTVIPYIQNLLAYDIGWRVAEPKPDILTDEEFDNYCKELSNCLSYIDDYFILKSKTHRSYVRKSALLRLKYGENAINNVRYDEEQKKLFFRDSDILIANLPKNPNNCEVYNVERQKNNILIEGLIKKLVIDSQCVTGMVINFNSKEYPVQLENYPHFKEETIFGTGYRYYHFSSLVPIDDIPADGSILWIKPQICFDNKRCDIAIISSGKRILSTNYCKTSYNIIGDCHYQVTPKGIKLVKPKNMFTAHLKLEILMLLWLIKHKHTNMLAMRILYYIAKCFKRKPLWIVTDRYSSANDNGEAFFRFLSEEKPNDINYEFVISKDSDDAKRMKEFGKVIYFDTLKFKLHSLLADEIISSQANDYVFNAFTAYNNRYIRDIYNFNFVFLQHGIIMNDLSAWLQKRNKKIDLFVTSSKSEKESIVNGDYGIDKDKVALTGLARFDRLYNQQSNLKKQVLILPTWRKSIWQSYNKVTNSSIYYDKFNETEYFKFFNDLINDERLLAVMRKHGYTGKFCLHPIHSLQAVDYTENDVFSVVNGAVNYQQIFTESAIMITDYSSVFFDFCYLCKPVIYSQFDFEEFYAGQIYTEGYFKHDRDGFGPVCQTYEKTVNELINSIKNDCKLESVYEERIHNFYAYTDNQNCRRIYDAIRKIDK